MAQSKSNYGSMTRLAVQFTATIPSGSPTSTVFEYPFGLFALGTVTPSGVIPAAAGTHLTIHVQDIWGVWRSGVSHESGFANWCIQHPTGGAIHDMPPAWFGVAGSARLVLTNGSGSGVPATGTQVFALSMKA